MAREKKAFGKKEQMKRKKNRDSDSNSEDNDSDDSFIATSDSEEETAMSTHELRKCIQKIFPSKYMDKKVKAGKDLKRAMQKVAKRKVDKEEDMDDEDTEDDIWETATSSDEDTQEFVARKKHKNDKTKKSTKKVTSQKNKKEESEESEDLESEDSSSEDEEEEKEENETKKKAKKSGGKLNIIFTIGGVGKKKGLLEDEEEEYDEELDEDFFDEEEEDEEWEEEEETEDEDEPVSSDSDSSDSSDDDEEEEKVKQPNQENGLQPDAPVPQEDVVLLQMKELLSKNPSDKSIQKCIEVYEEEKKRERKILAKEEKRAKKRVVKKEKKQKAKNARIFRKIMKDKNSMNDYFFFSQLALDHQKKLIKELREINKITRIEKPYRMTLLEANIPVLFKAAAMKKVNSLRYLEPGSGDFYKIKNWVDTFMKIPFATYQSLPISIENGVDSCHAFMEDAQKILDEAVYGLNDAKMQIMQMLGQLLSNPKAIGTAIAIHGPPGTGKTSLVKEGISKILNRPFAFLALGGATDSSFLEGHSYTYEGSTWGKIVQILIDSKCMNPVIYFDELDKISETPRGEEIAGILTHLTDTSQNSQFHDKYFAEIDFDLSKCLFIFSYNDESRVNPILRDRMYRIKTKGYTGKEKTIIANNYLLPRIKEQVKFNHGDIVIPDDVLGYINEQHCNREDGVRNLKRCLEIIYTKLNLYRLMKPGTNLFEGEISLQVQFPFQVTKQIVDKLIKRDSDMLETWRALYV